MQWKGKYVAVLGARRSGQAAKELLLRQGAQVRVLDSQPADATILPQAPESLAPPLDLVVISPGVPLNLPVLDALRVRQVPIIGEVELASFFLRGPVAGITGSNGKTTTTALTGHLFEECGLACQVGGNIGTAVTSLVETSRDDQWNVLELSSFQLETAENFHSQIAACLNVTPDHLDRHGNFENYAAAKERLFSQQQGVDFAVLNYDDATCCAFAARTKAQVRWFSVTRSVDRGMWLEGEELLSDGEPFLKRSEIRLRGLHNVENVLAASLIAQLAGGSLDSIRRGVGSFSGVEHRLEFVRNLEGVDYFNDSKATNVDAALKAIEAFDGNLWLILGGKDKESDYRPLRAPLEKRAKGVLLIGAPPPYPYAAAPLIKKVLDGAVPLVDCNTLDAALHYARQNAGAGDTVLLAPACASFDQFENYEMRGKEFKQIVRDLY